MNGIILIDKPEGWTSQDVSTKVKHLLHEKKVGHCGILDPFATGLLVLTVGNATKISSFIEGERKTYQALLKLGKKTNTADKDGEVVEEKIVPSITKEEINKVLSSLLGKQKQLPPMFSSVRINGKHLYEFARDGVEVERKERDVEIFSMSLLTFIPPDEIIFSCEVSKGTYIRTLGEEIATRLGALGYLEQLRRTKVGDFSIKEATTIEKVSDAHIYSIRDALPNIKKVVVNLEGEKKVRNGIDLNFPLDDEIILVISESSGEALALYNKISIQTYHMLRGLW